MGHWISLDTVVWAASFLNVAAMFFQLVKIIRVKNTAGVSRITLNIFLIVQLTYAQLGWREQLWAQFWGMILSAAITSSILITTYVFPNQPPDKNRS